jgi:hypothetical protein
MDTATFVQNELAERGYYHGSRWDRGDLLAIAHELGAPRGDFRNPEIVRRISPKSSINSKANTLSSRYGLAEFPLHTETAYWTRPARYLVLRCVDPGQGRRPTTILDTKLLKLGPTERKLFVNEVWKVHSRRPFLCTLMEEINGHIAFRFDPECMLPITRGARRTLAIMTELLAQARVTEIQWSAGELLVLDNRRLLHGRGASTLLDEDRVLERVLIGERA